jgi:hypothetical protein
VTAAVGAAALAEVFPPEAEFVSQGVFSGLGGSDGQPSWQRLDLRRGRPQEISAEPGAHYLLQRIECLQDQNWTLWFASQDAGRVWLDGKLLLQHEEPRELSGDQQSVEVKLAAGVHQLLVKLVSLSAAPAAVCIDWAPVQGSVHGAQHLRALHCPAAERSESQVALLRDFYRREVSPAGKELYERFAAARQRRDELWSQVPTTLVLARAGERRPNHLLERGSFLQRGEAVNPGVPAILHPWQEELSRDRLGLARWLVSRDNPLVARVVVNRIWEQLFGRGLVATGNDFGRRGERPSHPELLDWLAVEFMDGGWSFKDLLRTILKSATYRQASAAGVGTWDWDPDNRQLARGARYRVDAELVRDLALSASGLLNREVGGPSVFPPQPEWVWAMTYNQDQWATDLGANRHRRGLYTFLRRTAPYPTLLMFDATSREISCSRRERSNTPLQALVLLNDPVFVEAAGALGRRMLRESGPKLQDRLVYGFRLCTGRAPDASELRVLLDLFHEERGRFSAAVAAASDYLENSGNGSFKDSPLAAELAALCSVASTLLNLDETITRG